MDLPLTRASPALDRTWGFYGANLWVQPNFVLQQIMMAPSAMDFLAPNYAVAQYLGAFYLSQALP